jgi:Tfp pilus assembly ATPase PilU
MNDKQAAEFERTKECNFAISPQGIGRFRVNAFMQQGTSGWCSAPSRHAADHRLAEPARRC